MSGHSHAKTVKRVKEAGDKKRSQAFSKMARLIWVAVKERGPNPETNPKLRLAIELARSVNMPKENIERAIKKGSGELESEKLEEVIFEAYGPGGVALIVEVIADNKNRALSQIKQILNQNNGKLAGEGSVKWMFERKGCIVINFQLPKRSEEREMNEIQRPSIAQEKQRAGDERNSATFNFQTKEQLEMAVIEAGAEDIYWRENFLNIYTKVEDLEKVKKSLEERGIKTESIFLGWIAKEKIPIDEKTRQACQRLFDDLDENDSVQETYSNIEPGR